MTLNTSLIERESKKLYLRYLKDPSIPDELCADIYLEFIRRMRKYYDKQEKWEGKKHIPGGLLGQIIKRTTQAIFAKNHRSEEKEKVLTEIVNRNASQFWCSHKSDEEREFFNRIARFLLDWSEKKKNYPEYIRIFLLYHAFHLSHDFIEHLAPATGHETPVLLREVEEMREAIRRRNNKQLERKVQHMGFQFYHKFTKQIRFKNGLNISHTEESDEEYRKIEKNREKVKRAIDDMKFVPTWVQLHKATGASEKMARYAYQRVTRAIKESFKDDTYWG